MKAVVVQSKGAVAVVEVPEPVVGEYDVLCAVLAASVCSGTDHHIIHGHRYQNPRYPLILGHEAIGRVVACGPNVRHLKVGDKVTRVMNRLPEGSGYHLQWGAFAERGIATDWQAMREDGMGASEWSAYQVQRVLPDGIDPIEACMIITWRETHSFFRQMGLARGSRLLVVGSGTQALAFTEQARNSGIGTVVVGNPERRELFTNCGAASFVSYRDDYVPLLRSGGYAPFGAIIDAVGKSEPLHRALPFLARGGKVGIYGLDEADNHAIDQTRQDITYHASNQYDEASSHDAVMAGLREGKLNPWSYLSKEHIYPLEKINEALEACRTRKVLKSVIVF